MKNQKIITSWKKSRCTVCVKATFAMKISSLAMATTSSTIQQRFGYHDHDRHHPHHDHHDSDDHQYHAPNHHHHRHADFIPGNGHNFFNYSTKVLLLFSSSSSSSSLSSSPCWSHPWQWPQLLQLFNEGFFLPSYMNAKGTITIISFFWAIEIYLF